MVDADADFLSANGVSKTGFKRKHGADKLRAQELETTREMLQRYDTDCVIACGPHVASEQFQSFMMEYRKSHPVIYVSRPVEDMEEYLGVTERGKMKQWMENVQRKYHQICNYEFFNLPESWDEGNEHSPALERLQSILSHRLAPRRIVPALQKTQTALARFLAASLGHNASSLSHDIISTIYPALPESRIYSNALRIPLAALAAGEVKVTRISPGADVLELLFNPQDPRCNNIGLDSALVSRYMAEIRRHLAVPIVLHVEMTINDDDDWECYFDLLYDSLRLAPEYLTVNLTAAEDDIRRLTARRGCTTILGTQHMVHATEDFWNSPNAIDIYNKAVDLGCDLVRITRPYESVPDNFSCVNFTEKVKALQKGPPVIAYNTGWSGHISVACNPVLTTVSHNDGRIAGGGSAVRAALEVSPLRIHQRWASLFDLHILDPLEFLLVGRIRNSLSPAMHNTAFQALGMPHVYKIHQVSEANALEEIATLLSRPNFGGASISMPFKKDILSLVQKLSPSAELIGAANTILPVRRAKDDRIHTDPRCKEHRHRAGPIAMLYADNTDWIGICACLSQSISPANSVSPDTTGLVIGAGGMGRAAVYGLLYLGVRNICIYNRTASRAHSVMKHYQQIFDRFVRSKSRENTPTETIDSKVSKGLRITVLESVDDPWPEGFQQPNIVICAIKAYREDSGSKPFTMPQAWLESPTGGVMVEVCSSTDEKTSKLT